MLTNPSSSSAAGDLHRLWYSDDYFDLIIWQDSEDQINGFQLCYDKPGCERALTWTQDRGFLHTAIDGGESKPTANRTPILVADGTFPVEQVRNEFTNRSALLPSAVRNLVVKRLEEYEIHQNA